VIGHADQQHHARAALKLIFTRRRQREVRDHAVLLEIGHAGVQEPRSLGPAHRHRPKSLELPGTKREPAWAAHVVA